MKKYFGLFCFGLLYLLKCAYETVFVLCVIYLISVWPLLSIILVPMTAYEIYRLGAIEFTKYEALKEQEKKEV